MQTPIVELIETPKPPAERVPLGTALTTVGTFAAGQAANGSFRVVAEADLGTFAEGAAAEQRAETAETAETA